MKCHDIMQKLSTNAAKIRGFGVTRLALFGSHARDEARSDSDLDFLVEFGEGRGGWDDFIHLQHLLEDLFHRSIDLGEPHLLREELKDDILGGKLIEAQI